SRIVVVLEANPSHPKHPIYPNSDNYFSILFVPKAFPIAFKQLSTTNCIFVHLKPNECSVPLKW
ncbi:MAG: hypothetical protein ACJ751_02370, partial [Niastella sp.]|uniref:hypothetical protein n=1 Tax=Niastella sp. TaxID=1869183 RepID=UPI003899D392